jgi:hypothetical protein
LNNHNIGPVVLKKMKLDMVISETPLAVSLYRQTQEHKDDRSQDYEIPLTKWSTQLITLHRNNNQSEDDMLAVKYMLKD